MTRVGVYTGTINLSNRDARATYIVETLKFISNHDDLEIILISPGDIPQELKDKANIAHKRYNIYDRSYFRYVSSIIPSIPRLLKVDCDVMHCYGSEGATIWDFVSKLRNKKIPTLFQINGLAKSEAVVHAESSFLKKFSKDLVIMRENYLFKRKWSFITLSTYMKEYVCANYGINCNDIYVAPIGVDVSLFSNIGQKNISLINQLGLQGKKVLLYSGWISALHGVLDLVKAMEIINGNRNDVTLLIVGDGPMLQSIQKYVRTHNIRNITFVGKVDFIEVPAYISISDVVVIPHVECMQTKLHPATKTLEYLVSKKPIVASRLRPIYDVLKSSAFFFEPGNVTEMADAILNLLDDDDLRKSLIENRNGSYDNYSWEYAASMLYDAYNKVAIDNK